MSMHFSFGLFQYGLMSLIFTTSQKWCIRKYTYQNYHHYFNSRQLYATLILLDTLQSNTFAENFRRIVAQQQKIRPKYRQSIGIVNTINGTLGNINDSSRRKFCRFLFSFFYWLKPNCRPNRARSTAHAKTKVHGYTVNISGNNKYIYWNSFDNKPELNPFRTACTEILLEYYPCGRTVHWLLPTASWML